MNKTLDTLYVGSIVALAAWIICGSSILPILPDLVVFATLLALFFVVTIKRTVLRSTARLPALRIAGVNEFPQLDVDAFNRCDEQLAGLGFERRFCYATELSPNRKGLGRLYYHPTHRCLATNSQLFPGNRRMEMVSITSKLDDNWSIGTSNVKPNAVNCVWRRPRALWNALPGAEPRELMDAHLQLRQRVMDELGVANVTDDMETEAYFDTMTRRVRQDYEAVRRKNVIVFFLEYRFYKMKPMYSWMGDLEKAVKDRQGS